ncbi:MAG: hypothetical protein FWH04_01615 [Oscillospiraceae bacterium]|nr:hypothetical protein [Oscillospiraceae bacterium]
MNSFLIDRLSGYAGQNPARFHMPGHKGLLPPPFDKIAPLDVTELPQTGSLYFEADEGAVRKSEKLMSGFYRAADCFYLTGGATQGIYAMLSALLQPGDTVLVDRASHCSVYHALALFDLNPVYFFRETIYPWGVPGRVCSSQIPGGFAAAIYTQPSYYGVIAPAPQTNAPLLCDGAHGAHLPFVLDNYTPPARLWTVSAHKTLGALGQSALLLSDGSVPASILREKTAVFGTASPSFVLLSSIDSIVSRIFAWDFNRIRNFTAAVSAQDERVLSSERAGVPIDPCRITLCTGKGFGDAHDIAQKFGVIAEMADSENIVFLLSPHNTDDDLARLLKAIESIPMRPSGQKKNSKLTLPHPVLTASPHEAFWAPKKQVEGREAIGKTAAATIAPSPPGIPILAPGEKIERIHIEFLEAMNYNRNDMIFQVLA